jgi:D-alanyl-D-alanine carboxypeptidase (penicillin-binding protein 5/6)
MTPRLLLAALLAAPAFAQAPPLPPKAPPDPLDGPPFVSAKAWAVVDLKTGKPVGGGNDAEPRAIASTTKIMTAHLVFRLAAADPAVLDEVMTYSKRAAGTPGTSSKVREGERLPVREVLYGLLLPSGNDAATALAEHFGPRLRADGEDPAGDPLPLFVGAMNRRAKSLDLKGTSYLDPHGLGRNLSTARDLAVLAREALRDDRFREYVSTRRREATADGPEGKRDLTWTNTNRLLATEGYSGVKTGTTNAAGSCLVATGRRGDDRLLVVVLGSTSDEGRYVDARNLFRWAWLQRGHEPGR